MRSRARISFNTDINKNHIWKFHALCAKSFDDSAKNRYFLGFYNGSRNMFVNRGLGSCLCYLSNNDAKTCSYGLTFSSNAEIKYFCPIKAYFHAFDTFLKSFF